MRNVESRDVEDTNAQFEGSIEDLTLWDIILFTLEEEFGHLDQLPLRENNLLWNSKFLQSAQRNAILTYYNTRIKLLTLK